MKYEIISTGSKGNAVVIEGKILIDCGVNYKAIKPYVSNLQLVLLTHEHGDHFYPSCIKTLARERPTLRFGCCKWLYKNLLAVGVNKRNIDIYTPETVNDYKKFKVETFNLAHNVPNCGYKIQIGREKLMYATDTNNLYGVSAPDYDLYLIEANYEDKEIQERIRQKEQNGQYAYEHEVLKNHLSKQKCDDFIARNAGIKSKYIYMHRHIKKEDNENE